MFTVISLLSLPYLVLMWTVSLAPFQREFILAKPFPKLRPTLQVWAAIVVLCAVDFTAILAYGVPPEGAFPIYICDGALVLALLFASMSAQRTILDLWGIAVVFGIFILVVVMLISPPSEI